MGSTVDDDRHPGTGRPAETSNSNGGGPASTLDRCPAAHGSDPHECDSVPDAVWLVDAYGSKVRGCFRHVAVMYATLTGARLLPGSVLGAVTVVMTRAAQIGPFGFNQAGGSNGGDNAASGLGVA